MRRNEIIVSMLSDKHPRCTNVISNYLNGRGKLRDCPHDNTKSLIIFENKVVYVVSTYLISIR